MKSLDHLVCSAADCPDPIVAIAAANDIEVLKAVDLSLQKSLASFILFADEKKLTAMLTEHFPHLVSDNRLTIEHAASNEEAALGAVKAVSSGGAHVVMKGNLPTAVILKAVLNKEFGLRTGKVLSHVAAFEVPSFDKLFFVTDAAMNIAPDLKAKTEIIENTVQVARACGLEQPVVAPLAAVETINPAMQPTLDAASLVLMNQRGQIKTVWLMDH